MQSAADDAYRPDAYRADIDGLRAVAVLAVVAFHAFPEWLPGGYVGVDVFFVISGFLISNHLMAEAAGGSISFGNFYARRIRRIFPALIAVLLTVAIAGWFVLMPHEWIELRKHVGASAIFGNNILLWSESGYFDTASELKPLLHLWSLGVEEQFYLVWPLLIWWWWKRQWRWTTAIAVLVAASFGLNVYTVETGDAHTAFFLPHTRLWQLGLGGLLAAFARDGEPAARLARLLYRSSLQDGDRRAANLMSASGLLLILVTCASLARNGDTAYPGWAAAAPTVGAVLVIAAGAGAVLNRSLLSARAMVFGGLISYPLYLWHWPILSFLQITEQGDVSPQLKAAAIALSLTLASITYLFVERPLRRKLTPATLPNMEPVWIPLAVIGLVMEVAIVTGTLTPPARTALQLDTKVRNDLNASVCRKRFPDLGEYCQQFHPDLPVRTAVLGDSHAAHMMPGLGGILRQSGETVVHLGQTGCPPLLGLERLQAEGDNNCLRVNRAVIDAVKSDASITTVWLSFRGVRAVTGNDLDDARVVDLFRISGGTATNAMAVRDALRTTIAELKAGGKRVGVILQVPETGFRPDECTGRPVSIGHGPARYPCTVPRADVMQRQAAYRDIVSEMQREFGIEVYDPIPALCDETDCHAVADGNVLYVDDNHLGTFGSHWALRQFTPARE